jgi:two-component system copper resistance phosphate regulon response regulator CusR
MPSRIQRWPGRARVLIVEDEPRIATFLCRGFVSDGFEAEIVGDGAKALESVRRFEPNLVLLDLALPGIDGLELLRRLVESRPELPVLVLSACRDLESRLTALRTGASDYVSKPFSFEELVERVVIHLRSAARQTEAIVRADPLILDLHTRQADFGEGPIALTERQTRLLEHLVRRRGEVISRERLLSAVWGSGYRPDTNAVDVCIKRLRDKLGPQRIETVRNGGYRYVG